jgi:uncharacterized membrane protein
MKKLRFRVPLGLPIAMVVCLVIGLIANPVIDASVSEEQLARNVLLAAVPFIFIFVAIILAFISLVWLLASSLSHNIPEHIYRPVERVIIAGIVVGVIGMFQPWVFTVYRLGFFVLFFSTLAFILWSHIVPKGAHQEHVSSLSVTEFEQQRG